MSDPVYQKARQQVKKKKGFYVHLGTFIAVGIFFLAMNILTFEEAGEWWFFFPMLPWGIGLMIHYFIVFGLPGTKALSSEWEEKELQREMERLRRKQLLEKGESLPDIHTRREPGLDLPDLDKIPEKEKQRRWEDDELV